MKKLRSVKFIQTTLQTRSSQQNTLVNSLFRTHTITTAISYMMSLVLTKRVSLRSWEDTTISFAYMNNSQKDGQALLFLSYRRNLRSQQSQQKVKMKHILLNEGFSLRGSFVNFPLGILWSMVRSVRFSLEHNMVMLVNNSKRCLHSRHNKFLNVWPVVCKLMSLSKTRDWSPSTTDLLLSFSLMWKK